MDDFTYAKFIICDYAGVRKVLSKQAASSSSDSGIERFLFDDSSSATIPSERKRSMMMTVPYSGRHYPHYVGSLDRCLKRVSGIRI